MRIEDFLFDHDIEFKTKGKNIGKGNIGIKCIYCNDKSNHLAIKKNNGVFYCLKCGERGNMISLIVDLLSVSKREAIKTSSKYDGISESHGSPARSCQPVSISWDTVMPPLNEKFLPSPHKKYLEKRKFNPDFLQWKYNLSTPKIYNVGDWKHRIIIPYFDKKKIITYSGRSISENPKLKYFHLSEKKCIRTPKQVLYGLEFCSKNIMLVEGVTDVWAIGDGAVALSGKQLTPDQEILLLEHNPKKVYILLDPDAIEQAKDIANRIRNFTNVEILSLLRGDPAEQDQNCLNKIKYLLKK